MKLVREHIYEKFTQDSDPIEDMGIGPRQIYKNLKIGDFLRIKEDLEISNRLYFFPKDSYIKIYNIFPDKETNKHTISFFYYTNLENVLKNIESDDNDLGYWIIGYDFFKKYFEKTNLNQFKIKHKK